MNKKIILILFPVLLLGAFFLFKNDKKSTLKKELSDFAVKDTAAITKIFLSSQDNVNSLLERIDENRWTINKKNIARQDGINNLLETINRVRVKTPINKAAFENVIKKIASKGVKVEIYMNNEKKPTKVYYIGGSSPELTGTGMLLEGSSVPFFTHIEGFYGFLSPRYITNPNEWKDRAVFRYNYGDIATLKVEHPLYKEQSFEITDLGNNTFSLMDLTKGVSIAQFDTIKIMEYLGRFKNIHYEGYEETKTPEFIASIKASTPQQIITVTGKDGKVTQCKVFLKPAHEGATDFNENPIDFDLDRMYAQVRDADFVVVQHIIFDKLNVELDYFRK